LQQVSQRSWRREEEYIGGMDFDDVHELKKFLKKAGKNI
jgi:hypothetical protein